MEIFELEASDKRQESRWTHSTIVLLAKLSDLETAQVRRGFFIFLHILNLETSFQLADCNLRLLVFNKMLFQ